MEHYSNDSKMACGGITTMTFTATVIPEIVPAKRFQIEKI
jgi:hypothetical protein